MVARAEGDVWIPYHGHLMTLDSLPEHIRRPHMRPIQPIPVTKDGKQLVALRDPAMLIWLDNFTSRKEAPNENYGRELLELFSMGIGNYTEDDIKAFLRGTYEALVEVLEKMEGKIEFGLKVNWDKEQVIRELEAAQAGSVHGSQRLLGTRVFALGGKLKRQ